MTFDRSKFKATQVSALKEQEKAAKDSRNNGNSDGRVQFHKIEEGQSKWRIMPAHPDSKTFMQPKQVHWLPQEVTYQRDGKDVTEIKRRPIFNSRTHAGTSKDIVEEYLRFVTKMVYDEIQDPEERKKRLYNLTHWSCGVRGRTTWIVYAQKIEGNAKTLGRLELPGLVKDKMNELAITEDQSNDVIQTDPFTDPDSGKAILITYDKSQKEPVKKYATTLEWRGDYALTDQDLEELLSADSLETIYNDSYRRKDFERALEGLRIFDEDNKYNAFGHDEWLDVCEHIDGFYVDEESDADAVDTAKPSEAQPPLNSDSKELAEKEAEQGTNQPFEEELFPKQNDKLPWDDEFEDMDRDALKAHIKANKLGIRVLQKYSDDDLRGLIREVSQDADQEADQEEDTESTATQATADVEQPAPKSSSKIAEMRARLQSKG